MGPLRWKLLPSLLIVLLYLPLRLGLQGPEVVAGDEEEPLPTEPAEPVEVTLATLREDPTAWVGERVRFTVQFKAREEGWNPGLTRFGPVDWVAFSGWGDERFTWELEVFQDPMRRLFVRRDSAQHELLSEARPYERFEVVGVVSEVLFEQPWIEVERLRPLFELVSEGTILHVGRAFQFARQGQWELALGQFERATSAPLPAHARAEIDRRIAECSRMRDEALGE